MAPTHPQRDLPGHWNAMQQALVTYRHSVDLYRQVLASRARLRPVHANGHSHDMAFSRVRDVGVSIPGARSSLDGLTPRELEVAQLMAQGHTNQQIADILVVTRGTAANHVAHILAKLGVANRTQVAARVVASLRASERDGPAEVDSNRDALNVP